MPNSTHEAWVVPVKLEKHPNADSLSIVNVFGYSVVIRTEDWKDRAFGVYIQPDSIVPDTAEYAFLKGNRRIRAKRLRGVISMGLLVPLPEGIEAPAGLSGEELAAAMGITHYEPPMQFKNGDNATPPGGYHPDYEVENFRRYDAAFTEGEEVVVTEKIHGTNTRFLYLDGEMHVGSHTQWKKYNPDVVWWKALGMYPALEEWLKLNPGYTVYGETYGKVQSLTYGVQLGFALFDILLPDGTWMDAEELHFASQSNLPLPFVPFVYRGPFNLEEIVSMAEGTTLVSTAPPGHIREGVVVKPVKERHDLFAGRVNLKIVGVGYLENEK